MFYLLKKIGVSNYERPRVKFLWSLRFLYQVGFIFAWTISTSIFVEHFGVENILFLLLVDALLFLAGSFVSRFLFLRWGNDEFLQATLLGTIFLIFIAFLFRENSGAFFCAALLAKDFCFSQLNIALYRKNESLFSPAEAQKMMPIIESGITIGTVTAAIIFLELLPFFSSKDIFFFWVLPLVIMSYLVWSSPKKLGQVPRFFEEKCEQSGIMSVFGAIEKIHFLRYLVLVIFVQSALFAVIDFEFLKSVEEHATHSETHFEASDLQANLLHDSATKISQVGHEIGEVVHSVSEKVFVHKSLAHDLGFLSLVFGVIALLIQLFLASRIFEKMGIVNSMFLYFGGLFGMLATFFAGGTNMNFVRGFQHGFHSIFDGTYHLSFYSIFSHRREEIRHFFEGFVRPAGIIFGVGSLMALNYFYEGFSSFLMVFLAAVLILLAIPMRKKYTHLSTQNLKSEKNVAGKLHSIEVLTQKGHDDSALILAKELLKKDGHPVVREKIISAISHIDDPKVVHIYLQILGDSEEVLEIKIQVLHSLLHLPSLKKYWEEHAFSQNHLLTLLQNLFEAHDHAHLKKLVVMNIFAHLPAHQIVPFFVKTLEHSDEEIRSICLRSCTVFEDPEIGFYIRKYLEDPNPKISGHAIISLWKFEDQTVLQQKLQALLEGDSAEEKISALYAIGEIGETGLNSQISQFISDRHPKVRLHALIALAKRGDETCLAPLLEILLEENSDLARAAFFMLDRVDPEIRDALKSEIQMAVSEKVFGILSPEKITQSDHLKRLSKDRISYLKRLYRVAEKYDDILVVERFA